MNRKRIFVICLISIICLGIISYFPLMNYINRSKVKKDIVELVDDYYNKYYNKYFAFDIPKGEKLTFSLEDLEKFGNDISKFEKISCDKKNTKAILTFKEDMKYKIKVVLDCEL